MEVEECCTGCRSYKNSLLVPGLWLLGFLDNWAHKPKDLILQITLIKKEYVLGCWGTLREINTSICT